MNVGFSFISRPALMKPSPVKFSQDRWHVSYGGPDQNILIAGTDYGVFSQANGTYTVSTENGTYTGTLENYQGNGPIDEAAIRDGKVCIVIKDEDTGG